MGKRSNKNVPNSATQRVDRKQVRTPPQQSDSKPSWRFSTVDKGGPFAWPAGTSIELDIVKKLHSFDSMEWSQIEGKQHHSISVDRLSKEAQKRLQQMVPVRSGAAPLHPTPPAAEQLNQALCGSNQLHDQGVNVYKTHECIFLPNNGISIVFSDLFVDCDEPVWSLIVQREATEKDIDENHYLENTGDTIWQTAVEIYNCPFCGQPLTTDKTENPSGNFVHIDSSGWSVSRL